jgi:hypothetical protein
LIQQLSISHPTQAAKTPSRLRDEFLKRFKKEEIKDPGIDLPRDEPSPRGSHKGRDSLSTVAVSVRQVTSAVRLDEILFLYSLGMYQFE